jgi:hypothetical protein
MIDGECIEVHAIAGGSLIPTVWPPDVLEDATPKLAGKDIVTDRKHEPEENPGASADGLGHWISDHLAPEHDGSRTALDSDDSQQTRTATEKAIDRATCGRLMVPTPPHPSRGVRFRNGSACALAGGNTPFENQAGFAEPQGSGPA